MSELSLIQRFWIAVHDIGRASGYVFRPWTELRAVKTTQVDIVNIVSTCQADVADAITLLNKFGEQMARLEARTAEHDALIRQLLERPESACRQATNDLGRGKIVE